MKRAVIVLTLLIFSILSPNLAAQDRVYFTMDGEQVDFDAARRAHRLVLFGAPPHVARMLLEQGSTLVLGSAWYWIYRDENSEDWDLDASWRNFGRRFTDPDMIRFDTNRFFVNQGHVFANGVHYAIPRINNFGAFSALGVGFLTSALWEWVFEYREYVSLNDLITSPVGGQALGEVMFKFGELYTRQRASLAWPAKALTYLFSRGRAFHTLLGDETPMFPEEYGPAMAHEFRADAGIAYTYASTPMQEPGHISAAMRLETSIVDLPGYLQPGTFDTIFRDGNFTRLRIAALIGDAPHRKRVSASARVDLVGYYAQKVSTNGDGWATQLSFSRGTWLDTRRLDGIEEMTGMVDLVGPNATLHLFLGRARLAVGSAVYADFGSVTSLAYMTRSEGIPPNRVRSELREQGYYFAWGVTATPWLRWQFGRLEARAQLDASTFAGLRGPDRRQLNDIDDPLRLRDRRLLFAAETRLRIVDPVDIALRFERLRRYSALDEGRVVRSVDELGIAVGAHF